jgi:hyperosmotically inducible protein
MKRIQLAALGAAAVLGLAACASTTSETSAGKSESAGQYVDDATVTAKVKTAIASDVGVRAASNVSVETYQGTVQLSGFADSTEQKSQAASAAEKVKGVRTVQNDIRVK